jgi:hypothetical protein
MTRRPAPAPSGHLPALRPLVLALAGAFPLAMAAGPTPVAAPKPVLPPPQSAALPVAAPRWLLQGNAVRQQTGNGQGGSDLRIDQASAPSTNGRALTSVRPAACASRWRPAPMAAP